MPTPDGTLFVMVWDKEDEIEDRATVAHLVKSPRSEGWLLWYHIPLDLWRKSGATYGPEVEIGRYPYIEDALRDVAYLQGQYWSPRR